MLRAAPLVLLALFGCSANYPLEVPADVGPGSTTGSGTSATTGGTSLHGAAYGTAAVSAASATAASSGSTGGGCGATPAFPDGGAQWLGFEAAAGYDVGGAVTALVVGDFNNDGLLDVATANGGTSSVSVLLGSGTGTFSYRWDTGVDGPVTLLRLRSADLNGDGWLDLIAVTNVSQQAILWGQGTGRFSVSSVETVGSGGTTPDLVTGDFNADGIVDLAVANSVAAGSFATAGILLGIDGGAFTAPAFLASPFDSVEWMLNPSPALCAGVFTPGGPDEVAISSATTALALVASSDAGGLDLGGIAPIAPQASPATFPGWLRAAVATPSGALDILSAGAGGTVGITSFEPDAGFAFAAVPLGSTPVDATAADVDGDGIPDLIAATPEGAVVMALGQGDGNFAAASACVLGISPTALAVGDFNGDGRPDVVVAAGARVLVLLDR